MQVFDGLGVSVLPVRICFESGMGGTKAVIGAFFFHQGANIAWTEEALIIVAQENIRGIRLVKEGGKGMFNVNLGAIARF